MVDYLLLFLIGLCVGSFLNVVIYRETRKDSRFKIQDSRFQKWLPVWLWGRSFCDHCGKVIAWYDNIPLLSFLFLGGKCRFCRKKISLQYPFVELLTAVEFIWIYWLLSKFSFFGRLEGFYSLALLCYWLFIFSISLVIFLVDLRKKVIPDPVLVPAIFVCLVRLFFTHQWVFLLWALAASGFFLFLYWVTAGKGMGFGDVKLAFLIGLILGWWQRILVAFFFAFLTGALVGGILVLLGKKRLKGQIPFGPFLIANMWLAKLFGDKIVEWYLGLIK